MNNSIETKASEVTDNQLLDFLHGLYGTGLELGQFMTSLFPGEGLDEAQKINLAKGVMVRYLETCI